MCEHHFTRNTHLWSNRCTVSIVFRNLDGKRIMGWNPFLKLLIATHTVQSRTQQHITDGHLSNKSSS